jgi:7-cyano-7-deazaguanine synthase
MAKESNMKSLVVMSGGQDSTTCLAWAKSKGDVLLALSFKYGQKHEKEILAAAAICAKLDVEHRVMDLSPIIQSFQSSALVNHGDTSKPHAYIENVPASFVPVRNALFLTAAFGVAMEIGAHALVTGVCETDYSGYPDCRARFINSLEHALSLGYNSSISIKTPLMYLNKAQTFKLAEDLDVLRIVLEDTLTCYNGDADTRNEWGRGCGECPACQLRAKGFEDYKAGRLRGDDALPTMDLQPAAALKVDNGDGW